MTAFKIVIPLFIFLLTIEGLSFFWLRQETKSSEATKSYVLLNPGNPSLNPVVAGFWAPPGSVIQHTIHPTQGPDSTAVYKINSFGIRDNGEHDKKNDKNLFLSGCSFVFGLGVKDDESLPGMFKKTHPSFNVYNLGFPSGGAHTALRLFDALNFKEMAPEKESTYIYFFVPFHPSRWFLSFKYLSFASPLSPYYEKVGNEIVYQGTIDSSFRFKVFSVLKWFSFGKIVLKKLAGGPYEMNAEEEDIFADGVLSLKKEYLEKYPGGRFIFLRHPLIGETSSDKPLREKLISRGIEYTDPGSDFLKMSAGRKKEEFVITGDGHPTGKLNGFLSQYISREILSSERSIKR